MVQMPQLAMDVVRAAREAPAPAFDWPASLPPIRSWRLPQLKAPNWRKIE